MVYLSPHLWDLTSSISSPSLNISAPTVGSGYSCVTVLLRQKRVGVSLPLGRSRNGDTFPSYFLFAASPRWS